MPKLNSLANGEYITLLEACAVIPGRPHINTVKRWASRGYAGVILETWKLGQRRVTSIPALDRFFAATTDVTDPNPRNSSGGPHRQAEAKLDAMGIV